MVKIKLKNRGIFQKGHIVSQRVREKISWANKGNQATLGKHWRIKDTSKMGLARLGKKRPPFSEDWKANISKGSKGKKLSEITKRKISLSHKGFKSYRWKGGITPLTKQIRQCFQYRQWRSDIFTRDDFTCQVCKKRGVYLEVDHYPKMFSTIFQEYKIKSLEEALACEELWNINNGRTVCQKHNPRGKRNGT